MDKMDVSITEESRVTAEVVASVETPPVVSGKVAPKELSPTSPKIEDQPSITDFIPTHTEEATIPVQSSPKSATPMPPHDIPVATSVVHIAPEVGQKTLEEVIQPQDTDTRKRKREQPPTLEPEPPSSPNKRAKQSSPQPRRSETPEPTPHRALAATQHPSIHPPTTAIYITCLSRPLNVPSFTAHVSSLTISKQGPVRLWLDSIKSHGYITFESVEDAVAVRAELNGISWPPNEKRRTLSVDFIPVEKVDGWISVEEQSRGQRFEVFYVRDAGEVVARHRVMEAKEPQGLKLEDTGTVEEREGGIPTGPRAGRGDGRERVEIRGGEKVRVVGPDELFRKTSAKPWVYWAEVSEDVRERRTRK